VRLGVVVPVVLNAEGDHPARGIQEPRQCPPRGRQTPETEGAPMTMLFLTICWVVIFTTLHLRIRILVRRVDELERKIR